MIRPIQEHDIEYERGVKHAACELAETHVLDVLSVVECGLSRLRFNLRPGHDGKVGSSAAIQQGNAMVGLILQALDEVLDIDYMGLVNESDDESRLQDRDEYVADGVRESVEFLVKDMVAQWKKLSGVPATASTAKSNSKPTASNCTARQCVASKHSALGN